MLIPFMTTEYTHLILASKIYLGPRKETMDGAGYFTITQMTMNDDIMLTVGCLLRSLHRAEPTRRHLAERESTKRKALDFMQSFGVAWCKHDVLVNHWRPVAAEFQMASIALLTEFEPMITALRNDQIYSLDNFWRLFDEYNKALIGWNDLIRELLPARVVNVMLIIDREARKAEANVAAGVEGAAGSLERLQAQYRGLRENLLKMPDGAKLVEDTEARIREDSAKAPAA